MNWKNCLKTISISPQKSTEIKCNEVKSDKLDQFEKMVEGISNNQLNN